MSEYIIYCLTNKVNGKKYVGQTTNYSKRMSGHQKKTPCVALYRAIQKYGWENFDKEVLVETDKENVDELETRLIKEHKTRIPNGYNIRAGGVANSEHHPSSVHKMKKVMPNRKPCSIQGVVYNGVRAAAAAIGESRQMIIHRLKSKNYQDWVYVGDEGYYSEEAPKPVVVEDKGKANFQPCVVDGVEYESGRAWRRTRIGKKTCWKRCEVDGVEYESMYQAARALGIQEGSIAGRMNNPNFPNWKKL